VPERYSGVARAVDGDGCCEVQEARGRARGSGAGRAPERGPALAGSDGERRHLPARMRSTSRRIPASVICAPRDEIQNVGLRAFARLRSAPAGLGVPAPVRTGFPRRSARGGRSSEPALVW